MLMLIARKHAYRDAYQLLRVVHCKYPSDAMPVIQTYANRYKRAFYLSDARFVDFQEVLPEKQKKL